MRFQLFPFRMEFEITGRIINNGTQSFLLQISFALSSNQESLAAFLPKKMDFQNRAGSKPGSGGVASASESNVARRERLRLLAMETIDLAKDPYFMKNHLGSYECKLCLTLHPNEGSYLAHTQGKKHQANLGRRAAKEAKESGIVAPQPNVAPKRNIIKIGRPGYKVIKIKDPVTRQMGMLYRIHYPQIAINARPMHRFMSAFEQKVDPMPPNRIYQYLLFAAEPYETIGFKINNYELDQHESKYWSYWDPDSKVYFVQIMFKRP